MFQMNTHVRTRGGMLASGYERAVKRRLGKRSKGEIAA